MTTSRSGWMEGLLATPRGWAESFGELAKFASKVIGEVLRLRVLKFFGEALRQSGILIISSTLVIWAWCSSPAWNAGSRGRTSTAPPACPRTPACSPHGATCASWCRMRSAT